MCQKAIKGRAQCNFDDTILYPSRIFKWN